MTDSVEIPIQPTKPAVSAADILKELQLSGVFDHMRAQALQQVVEKERSTAAPEQPLAEPEVPAAAPPEHSEHEAQVQSKSARDTEPGPAVGALQKHVREVAAAALAAAPPGASKGTILKQMRAAVAAEGLYAELLAMVDTVLEHDDAFQSDLVAAVQEATAEAVRPRKRPKTAPIVSSSSNSNTQQLSSHPPQPSS